MRVDVKKERTQDQSLREAVLTAPKSAYFSSTGSEGEAFIVDKLHDHLHDLPFTKEAE